MTYLKLLKSGEDILRKNGIVDCDFDVRQILLFVLDIRNSELIFKSKDESDKQKEELFYKLTKRRAAGEPLQYILGKWTFCDTNLLVGPGVLIPRDDTEVLVKRVIKISEKYFFEKKVTRILDLCSGSGAVAIAAAKNITNAEVTAIELFDGAFDYLVKNIELNNVKTVTPVKMNALEIPPYCFLQKFDIILSNPPYIETSELAKLQKEVQFEPVDALDGGEDGLKFYRSILKNYKKALCHDGWFCVEVGYDQCEVVKELFKKNGYEEVFSDRDINGIDRVVGGRNI